MIYDQMKEDRNSARRSGDKLTRDRLTTFVGEIETATKNGIEPDDAHIISRLKKEIQCLDENYRLTRQDEFKDEAVFLNKYMPQMASESDVRATVQRVINASDVPTIGAIMKTLKTEYGTLLDGRIASVIVKEELETIFGRTVSGLCPCKAK
jgi:uncharacterized protein YqeY